jgi:hypothetical protein
VVTPHKGEIVMSKLVKFLVTINGESHEVDTAKEVSRLLGRKVTRAQIISCMVPEVQLLDEDTKANTEVVENNNDVEDNSMKELDQATLDQVEEILNEGTEGDKETIAEYADTHEDEITDDATDEKPEVCSTCGRDIYADEDKYVQDGGDILCEECNHAKNMEEDTPGSSTGVTKMDALMARMKEINAKNAGTAKEDGKKGKRGKSTDAKKFLEENNGYPEVGFFKEEKDLKKFYKQLTDEQLDEWLEIEGLDYKPSDNEPINRMRKCMAILYCHFPRETKGSSKS